MSPTSYQAAPPRAFILRDSPFFCNRNRVSCPIPAAAVFAHGVHNLGGNRNIFDCVLRLRSLSLAVPHDKNQCSIVCVLSSFFRHPPACVITSPNLEAQQHSLIRLGAVCHQFVELLRSASSRCASRADAERVPPVRYPDRVAR